MVVATANGMPLTALRAAECLRDQHDPLVREAGRVTLVAQQLDALRDLEAVVPVVRNRVDVGPQDVRERHESWEVVRAMRWPNEGGVESMQITAGRWSSVFRCL